MQRTTLVITIILLIPLLGAVVLAREVPPVAVDAATVASPAPVGREKSGQAIEVLYPEEDFESGIGSWSGVDLTQPPLGRWQVSTFNAANLDPTPDNQAMWCGDVFDPCPSEPGDLPGGYGTGWNDALEWSQPATDPLASSNVNLVAIANVDTEPGADYLLLERLTSTGWEGLGSYSGESSGFTIDVSFTAQPADYRNGEIVLRFRVTSDAGWDAEDCILPNDGAAQIDNIVVSGDNFVDTTDDFDGGIVNWEPTRASPGVGDFAHVLADPPTATGICPSLVNHSQQLTFVNDGIIPALEPTVVSDGLGYPEGTFGVHPLGGLEGEGYLIANLAHSPPIGLSPAGGPVYLEFDWYIHALLAPYGAQTYAAIWVRYTMDPSGDTGWSAWDLLNNNYYYDHEPTVRRVTFDLTDALVPDAANFQVGLGVLQPFFFDVGASNVTPVVYYDNVTVYTVTDAFDISVRPFELAQDGFPATGVLDPVDLDANDVSFDAAYNTADPAVPLALGDQLIVTVAPLVAGLTDYTVKLNYIVQPNAYYDDYRSPATPLAGSVEAIPVGFPGQYKYECGLPDVDFLYPGDVVHYYFSAEHPDHVTVTYPADLNGFGDFTDTSEYPELFTFRALPSHTGTGTPRILVWNDSQRLDDDNNWPGAMQAAGYQPKADFDLFTTTAASSGLNNGLGACAGLDVLGLYDIIIYASGNISYAAVEPLDLDLLDSWLQLGEKRLIISGNHVVSALSSGNPAGGDAFLSDWFGVGLSGVGLVSFPYEADVTRTAAGTGVFENTANWMICGCPPGYSFEALVSYGLADDYSLAEFSGGIYDGMVAAHEHWNPDYQSIGIVFPYDLHLVACGGSTMTDLLDELLIYLGNGPVAAYLQTCDVTLAGGAVEVNWRVRAAAAAADFRLEAACGDASWVVPHALGDDGTFLARDDSPHLVDGQTVTYLLKHATNPGEWTVLYSEEITYKAVPRVTQLTGAQPNPFNPSTKILFSVRRAQEVEIAIYDLAGRLVNRIAQETFIAGNHELTWDGRDAAGARAPSGTYFVRMACEDLVTSEKMTMIK